MAEVFVKFRYEERDVSSALRAAMLARVRKRPDLWLAAIMLVLGLAAAARVMSGTARVIAVASAGVLVVAIVAAFVVVPKIMFRRGALRSPMAIDASDEGLTIIAGANARNVAWSDCARVDRGARVIVIHHGEEAVIVPRRAFRNRERERAFVELLDRYASRDIRRLDSGKSTPSANA